MEERNLSTCRSCEETKIRIEDGKYGESKNKRWRDAEGKIWRGRVCPECHKLEMKERMINKRKKDKPGAQ
jgi:predicted adenine nucleotide alpha hydrolase (AANH) superfamily ATPase